MNPKHAAERLIFIVLLAFQMQFHVKASAMPLSPPANSIQITAMPLTLKAPETIFAGDTLRFKIQIGNSDSLVNDLFALSYRLNYSSAHWWQGIPNPDGKIVSRGTFWPPDAFFFSRQDTVLNQFQIAITQLAGMPGLTGTGDAASLNLKIHPQIPDSTVLNFWLDHIVAINSKKDTLQFIPNELKVIVFQHPSFRVKCQPKNLSITWGETARYQVFLDSVQYLREKAALSGEVNPELVAEFLPQEIGKRDTAELRLHTKPKLFRNDLFRIIVQAHIPRFFHSDTIQLQVLSPPFFNIKLRPDTLTIFPGDSISTLVILDSCWNCRREIHLSCPDLPAEIGTGIFHPPAIFPGDSGLLKIQTRAAARPGEYIFKIIGQGNNLIDSTNLTLRIRHRPAFSLVVQPDFQSIIAGQQAKFQVQLDSVVNFQRRVHLQIANFPTEAGTVIIQPDSITSNEFAMVTISTQPAAPTGKFPLSIIGTGSGMTRTAAFSLEILPPPDFRLEINPLIQTIAAGESTSFQIAVTAIHQFQDSVAFSYSVPDGMDAGIFLEKQKIAPGMTTQLMIITNLKTKPANYELKILARADAIAHEQSVNLVITAAPIAAEWILPNPFTPNQDGFNDQVQFNLHQIETDGLVLIFNFRGQKVRELKNSSFWDGTDESGAVLPMGIYFYLVKIQNELKARGSLTLVR